MSLERPIARVTEWLDRQVAGVPAGESDSDGPVVSVEAFSERKRSDATRVMVARLEEGTTAHVATRIIEACVSTCVDVPVRGVTFYLYAINAKSRAVLAGFPVQILRSDTNIADLATTSSATTPSTTQVMDVNQTVALRMLGMERQYSADLAATNLNTLNAAAMAIERTAQLHESALKITSAQTESLLEQLVQANNRALASEGRCRDLERELRDKDKALRDSLDLAESLADKCEKLEAKLLEDKEGPMAQMKADLLAKLVEGAGTQFFTGKPGKGGGGIGNA